tara:strand:- start:1493 stop:2251 length:759 start_codon:yes stop_codon:yes gene_type:complete
MDGLPPELMLDFVDDDEPDMYVATDEPNVGDISPEPAIAHLVAKAPIQEDSIFASSSVPISDPKPLQPLPRTQTVTLPVQSEPPRSEPKPKRAKPERPVKLNKNGQPRKKRVYTEEQLAVMRERMAKVRAESGKNKAKKDEERAKEARYKELMKKKKEFDMEEVEEKIKKKAQPKPEPRSEPAPAPKGLTMEDLQKAQFEAIAQYDTLRKKRKAEKKQKQKVEQYHQDASTKLRKELEWRNVAGEYADFLGI